jgi:UDP-N-acetylglucosamine--N-acetylmuramyl-(pentapeptide) pyrophosphoryl-undecaprenol N-acetylglucosamine transferase
MPESGMKNFRMERRPMKEKRYMTRQKHKKVIISGGGTGGHIFPAISIANALKKLDPDIEILFVGAEGRMEMEKIPVAGYRIVGLPVAGLYRRFTFKNFQVIARLIKSLRLARKIIKEFDPDVVVGVGGYASGPVLRQAGRMKIPTLIQEQNSYAGVTNKLLANRAAKICVAYDGMEKYFPAEKIIMTGNPVRQTYDNLAALRNDALSFFRFKKEFPVILILGGSLGAGSINKSIADNLNKLRDSGCQWLWQTGKLYYENIKNILSGYPGENITFHDFINRMDYAYAAADVIVTRAGAGTISELCLAGKPVILVPSPNVAEDHQMKNARALSDKEAAVVIPDNKSDTIVDEAIRLVADVNTRNRLSANIKKLAVRDADIRIAQEVLRLTGND